MANKLLLTICLMVLVSTSNLLELNGQSILVKDFIPGTVSSEPSHFRNYHGKLLFNARKFITPNEYIEENWTSDGTMSGTTRLGNVKVALINFKNDSYYFENTSNGTLTLSKTTPSTTTTVVKTFPNQFFSQGFYMANDFIYFVNSATSPAGSCNISQDGADVLWRSDGTTAGTTQIGTLITCKTTGSNNFNIGMTSGNNFFLYSPAK